MAKIADGVRRHRRALGLLGAAFAAGLAVMWAFVVPDGAHTTTGLQHLTIRWGHSLVWALLGVAALLVAFDGPSRLRAVLGYAALACYVAFLLAVVL